jgi:hypothetical protein
MRAGSPFNRVQRIRRGVVDVLVIEFFAGKYRMWRYTPLVRPR